MVATSTTLFAVGILYVLHVMEKREQTRRGSGIVKDEKSIDEERNSSIECLGGEIDDDTVVIFDHTTASTTSLSSSLSSSSLPSPSSSSPSSSSSASRTNGKVEPSGVFVINNTYRRSLCTCRSIVEVRK